MTGEQMACPANCDDGVDWSTGNAAICEECNGSGSFYVKQKGTLSQAIAAIEAHHHSIISQDESLKDYIPDYLLVIRTQQRMIEANTRDLAFISKISRVQYEEDNKLRSDGARTLKRIAEKADEALKQLESDTIETENPMPKEGV